jgi:predicted RNase H-like HicB family nuclease
MIRDYMQAAMRHAHYEMIDQPGEPFFGSIPECRGVIAIGKTLEECRENLEDALDNWLVLGFRLGHEIPEVDGIRVEQPAVTV